MLLAAVVLIAAQVAPLPAPAAPPDAEAQRLGRQLAETGTLASLLPLMVRKETEDLVRDQRTLAIAEQAELRRIAAETAAAGKERAFAAEARAYAASLSKADLRALVAFQRAPAAARWRAAQPAVITATIQALDGFDFKKQTLATFCARTGKACEK